MPFTNIQNTRPSYSSAQKHNLGFFACAYILTIVISPLSVYGSSFDCTKATSTVEKMICANEELSRLDSDLAAIYKKVLTSTKNTAEIKATQKQWLTERNTCSNASCVKAAYKKRINELEPSGQSTDGQKTAENSRTDNESNTPVRIEDLGENWQYKRDADKLLKIRPAMTEVEIPWDAGKGNRALFCKTFKKDFLSGKFQVIEPDLQIMSIDDPRFDQKWHRCDVINREESTATQESRVFTNFPYLGLVRMDPPYRFYRIPIDLKHKDDISDVIEVRFDNGLNMNVYKVNGYDQGYLWVDLKGCEIRGRADVSSPTVGHPDWPDALSMLIRYQGRAMVLSYQSFPSYNADAHDIKAKPGEHNNFNIRLTDLLHDQDFCVWATPKPREALSDRPPPTNLYEAGIDCTKATSEVERHICSDNELLGLDDELGSVYQSLKESTTDQNNLILEQQKWLTKRNACQGRGCVKIAYEKRIDFLRSKLGKPHDLGRTFYIHIVDGYPPDGFDKLQPVLSDGLKAILAMYALRSGTGCYAHTTDGLQCGLTQSLGFRSQCSPEHIEFVRTWFSLGIPSFMDNTARYYRPPYGLENLCYRSPDTASAQSVWNDLTIMLKKNGEIFVDATGGFYSHGDEGNFRFKTTYRINGHTVEVLNNRSVPAE